MAPILLRSALLACLIAVAAPAAAEEFEIPIHHTEVLDTGVKPKLGDTLAFVNHADIAHNLYLTYEDGTVETLDTQPPRTTKRTTLKHAGHVIVRCWIHPIIRMEFDVAAN
ncbi:hypothetical protein GCM10008171_04880 [Methylopila jiangsuensis]|uniref:Methylamine utilization protein MauL n=1 Tax=Methylopila jiangsuensis TaxID=586230 RepID=A0A9W6N1U1_9HYPH|nr:methylamine utilization protein MauL [Methylopila jiangsuensis]MDR6285476.1 plastocyanin [Methylopila jiangsuensis]GLK75234.1 hypothetical protein GCM10008171_04880 [Methylopila jiangsuensis]